MRREIIRMSELSSCHHFIHRSTFWPSTLHFAHSIVKNKLIIFLFCIDPFIPSLVICIAFSLMKPNIVRPNPKNSSLYDFVQRHDFNRGDLHSIKLQCQADQKRSTHKSSASKTKPKADSWQDVSRKIRIIDAMYIRNHFDDTIPNRADDEDAQVLSQTIQLLKPSHTALAGGVLCIPYHHHGEFINHYAADVAKDMKNNWQSNYDSHGQHSLSEFGHHEAFPFFLDWDAYFGKLDSESCLTAFDQDLILLVVKICQAAMRRYYACYDDDQWSSLASACVLQTLPRVAHDHQQSDAQAQPSSRSYLFSSSSSMPIDMSDSNASWLTETIPDMMSEHSRSSQDASSKCDDMHHAYRSDEWKRSSLSNLEQEIHVQTRTSSTTSSCDTADMIIADSQSNPVPLNKELSASKLLYETMMKMKASHHPDAATQEQKVKHMANMNEPIPVTQFDSSQNHRRYKVGIHIHFWKLIVNVNQAQILRRICIAELASNLNYNHAFLASSSLQCWGPFKDMSYARSSLQFASKVWEAMMDEAVYTPVPHCRMFGSHKVVRKLCDHCKKNRNFNCLVCGGGRALSEGPEAMVDMSYLINGLGEALDDQRLHQLVNKHYRPSGLHTHLQKYPMSIWKGKDHQVTSIDRLHAPYQRMLMSSASMDTLVKYIKYVLGRSMIRLPIDHVTSVFERHCTPGFDPSVDGYDLPSDPLSVNRPRSREQYTILINIMCENALIQEIRKLNPAWSALNFAPFIFKNNQWVVECHGVGSKTCMLSKSTHRTMSIYFVVTPIGIMQACHSSKPRPTTGRCTRNKQSPVWPIPTKLIEILFPNANNLQIKSRYNTAYVDHQRRDDGLEPLAKRPCLSDRSLMPSTSYIVE